MHIPAQYLRPFPEAEDIFADNIAEHFRHFLPICSLNLQLIQPDAPETWLHLVQPADFPTTSKSGYKQKTSATSTPSLPPAMATSASHPQTKTAQSSATSARRPDTPSSYMAATNSTCFMTRNSNRRASAWSIPDARLHCL